MREFELQLTKSLSKGLRPFPRNELVAQMLSECFNMMPAETGLVPHETVCGIGFTTVYFNYLRIKSQNGDTWFWYSLAAGVLTQASTAPSIDGLDTIDLTPSIIPYWLTLKDELAGTWYLYPSNTLGYPLVSTTVPTTGTGRASFEFGGSTGQHWTYAVNSVTSSFYPVEV